MIKNKKETSAEIHLGGISIPSSKRIKLLFDVNEFNSLIAIKDINELKSKLIKKVERRCKKVKAKIRPIRSDDSVVATAEQFRAELIKNQTAAEKKFKVLLKQVCSKYVFQHIFYFQSGIGIKKFYILDFYIPGKKICFEIDGGYHNDKLVKLKDNKRTRVLHESGITVYRISNDEVNNTKLIEDKLNFILAEKPLIIEHKVAVKKKK